MTHFISKSSLLSKAFERRKNEVVTAFPTPVSEVCKHCWYQGLCTFRVMTHNPPNSCCVYEFFGTNGNDSSTIEEMVSFTCDVRCKARQGWVGDPCPHDESYCENHCPVSKFITGQKASDVEDVPYEEY